MTTMMMLLGVLVVAIAAYLAYAYTKKMFPFGK